MNNLFWYTRKEKNHKGEDVEFLDSFNINRILRTMTLDDGRMLVLLDDIHNRISEVPVKNKRNSITGYKNQTLTVQSEITLEKEDVKAFIQMTKA